MTKNKVKMTSTAMKNMSRLMAATMAVAPLVALVPGASPIAVAVVTSGIDSSNLSSDNSYMDIHFTAGVYGSNQSVISATYFTTHLTQGAYGAASAVTVNGVTQVNGQPLIGGEVVVRLHFSITGKPNGNEAFHVSLIGSEFYNGSGNNFAEISSTASEFLNAPGLVSAKAVTSKQIILEMDSVVGDYIIAAGDYSDFQFTGTTGNPAGPFVSTITASGTFITINLEHTIIGATPTLTFTPNPMDSFSGVKHSLGRISSQTIERDNTARSVISVMLTTPNTLELTMDKDVSYFNFNNFNSFVNELSFGGNTGPTPVIQSYQIAGSKIIMGISSLATTGQNLTLTYTKASSSFSNGFTALVGFSAVPISTPADITAPDYVSATVDETGNAIFIEYNENIVAPEGGFKPGDFIVTDGALTGYPVGVNSVSIDTMNSHYLKIDLAETVSDQQSIYLEILVGAVRDSMGNNSSGVAENWIDNQSNVASLYIQGRYALADSVVIGVSGPINLGHLPAKTAFRVIAEFGEGEQRELSIASLSYEYISAYEAYIILHLEDQISNSDTIKLRYIHENGHMGQQDYLFEDYEAAEVLNHAPNLMEVENTPTLPFLRIAGHSLVAGDVMAKFKTSNNGFNRLELQLPSDGAGNQTNFSRMPEINDFEMVAYDMYGNNPESIAISGVYSHTLIGGLDNLVIEIEGETEQEWAEFTPDTQYALILKTDDLVTLPTATIHARAYLALSGGEQTGEYHLFRGLAFGPRTLAPVVTNISMVNNLSISDDVFVTAVPNGATVKVYDALSGGNLLGSKAQVSNNEAIVKITGGLPIGNIYVTITDVIANTGESLRTAKSVMPVNSAAPNDSDITMVNNLSSSDAVVVTAVPNGATVKVYDALSGGSLLGSQTSVTGNQAVVNITSGLPMGNIYVTITDVVAYADESPRTPKAVPESIINYTITKATAIALNSNSIAASATISAEVAHAGNEYVVFELIDLEDSFTAGIVSTDSDMDIDLEDKVISVQFSNILLKPGHSYSIKVYVASSFEENGHVIGNNLALIKEIPVITFNQLNISGNDSVIGIDDIMGIITGSASGLLALQDINNDDLINQADDIRILLGLIQPKVTPVQPG